LKTIVQWWLVIVSGSALVLAVVLGYIFIRNNAADESVMEASGRNQLRFQVHYLPNPVFPNGPSSHLHFLRNFTDFIEVENSFSVELSESLHIRYSYTARTNLIVTYGGTAGSIVFEEETILNEGSGNTQGDRLSIPDGSYIIDLDIYMQVFENFLYHHEQFMDASGEGTTGFRNFNAALHIEFIHTIETRPTFMAQTIINGYEIPLGQNVFTLTPFGAPGFTDTVVRVGTMGGVGIIRMILVGGLFLFGVFGLTMSYFRLEKETNTQRKQVNTIIKKYEPEIIKVNAPMHLEKYQRIRVGDFEEILKLAVNLGKHITCYKDNRKASFTVIVDTMAYQYIIYYTRQERVKTDDTVTKISDYLAKYDMYRDELSIISDVSQEMIDHMENGKFNPLLKQAYFVAKALGVTIEEVFNLVDEQENI